MNTKYLSANPLNKWLIKRFVGALISLLSSVDNSVENILDVGCGEGIVPRQLRHLWPSAIFHGLDIDPELLKVARELVPDLGCVSGSIYLLPFSDASYDLVCCTEVLEHLEYPQHALSEIKRIGSSYFIFSVPNEPLWHIANMARGSYWSDWGNSPGHLNHWSSAGFIGLLSQFFEVVNVKRPLPWTIVLCRK